MSTPKCGTCHKPYWRYRGDFSPPGYCSIQHYLDRTRRQKKKPPAESAAQVLEAYRDHRMNVHVTKDLWTWFDCELCERFEERYAVSMYL